MFPDLNRNLTSLDPELHEKFQKVSAFPYLRVTMNFKMFGFFSFIALFAYASGEICQSPSVESTTYTTTDGMVVSDVALITEFSVTCDKNIKDFSLYAEVKGKTFPAVKSSDSRKFQVSWTVESAKISSGSQDVKLYDEEGFAALRKAQRSGDKTEIPSTFSIDVFHLGTYYGPFVQSEFLAATCSVILWYIAFSARSKLIS